MSKYTPQRNIHQNSNRPVIALCTPVSWHLLLPLPQEGMTPTPRDVTLASDIHRLHNNEATLEAQPTATLWFGTDKQNSLQDKNQCPATGTAAAVCMPEGPVVLATPHPAEVSLPVCQPRSWCPLPFPSTHTYTRTGLIRTLNSPQH